MKRPPAFRPDLMILENRWLPAVSVYPDVVRNAIQQSYVAQADTNTNAVVFLGDSITYLWGTASREAPGSAAFAADFSGAANFGIIGDTTQNLLGRIEGGDLNGQPRVAVVMIGVNDLIGGSTPAQAAAGVTSVVEAIHAASPGTNVLLLGVLPTEITALNPEIRQLDALISGLGKAPGVMYLNPGVLFQGADGNANPSLLMDLVHPDAAGYQILAAAIDGTVLDLLDGGVPTTTTAATTSPGKSPQTQTQTIAASASSNLGFIPLVTSVDTATTAPSTSTSTAHARSFATELIDVSAS